MLIGGFMLFLVGSLNFWGLGVVAVVVVVEMMEMCGGSD